MFLEKMEIGESFLGENLGKLAHLWNLAPKIIYSSKINKDHQKVLNKMDPKSCIHDKTNRLIEVNNHNINLW